MLNRTDAILAGLTTVAVLSICFLTYQILKEWQTKVAKVQPTRSVSTPLVKPDFKNPTRSKQIQAQPKNIKPAMANRSEVITDSKPVKPVLIGTTATEPTFNDPIPSPESQTPEPTPTLADIHFDFNQGELPEEAQTQLQDYEKILKSGKWEVLIQGHTDRRGSVGFNLHVGQQRAQAVKDFLTTLDVPQDRLHVISLGKFDQACKQDTDACAETNRRVVFTVIKGETKETQFKGDQTEQQKEDELEPLKSLTNSEEKKDDPSKA